MKTFNKELSNIQLSQAIEQLEDLLFCDLVMIYNDYADVMKYERILDNDEYTLNEIFNSPYDAIRQTNHKDYNQNDDYFIFNGYGHVVSFSYQLIQDDNNPVDIKELAEWLVNEDKLNDYDITVTTLDDMLASIEDNITDDESLLNTVCQYLHLNHITLGNDYSFDEKVDIVTELINSFNYEQLDKLVTDLNINYQ